MPTLGLLGKQHFIRSDKPYSVDDDVQLVCKYLQAYEKGSKSIDRLYREGEDYLKGWTIYEIIITFSVIQ